MFLSSSSETTTDGYTLSTTRRYNVRGNLLISLCTIFQETITYHISSERLYFSLLVDIKHVLIIFNAIKMYLENIFFHFHFLNMDILVTMNNAIWIFETCPQNNLI